MDRGEVVSLSHDLLQDKVFMSIEFKNMNGATNEKIDIMFRLKAAAQETEPQVKEHALAMAKAVLRRAADSI